MYNNNNNYYYYYYYYNRLISKKKWWDLEMQFHLIVVWFHLKIWNSTCVYQKRGGLLWPIARKKDLISLRSAAFFILLFYYLKLDWARSKQNEIYQGSYKKLQPFFKDFSRITLDFQGPPTRNTISKIVQKCTFPVCSNKSLRLELFASSTSLHVSVYWS